MVFGSERTVPTRPDRTNRRELENAGSKARISPNLPEKQRVELPLMMFRT